ncbi:hypothetical protein, partial [Belliella pelovolcani]|uniref:hypothetical protein n=1 Tax=Belliella pelovolcani TaxID=529505 RepID=UPI00391A23BB
GGGGNLGDLLSSSSSLSPLSLSVPGPGSSSVDGLSMTAGGNDSDDRKATSLVMVLRTERSLSQYGGMTSDVEARVSDLKKKLNMAL